MKSEIVCFLQEQNAKDKNWDKIALAYNNRGHLKYLSVDFDGAVDDYNKALEYNVELSSCYYNRGTIFYRMGKIHCHLYFA